MASAIKVVVPITVTFSFAASAISVPPGYISLAPKPKWLNSKLNLKKTDRLGPRGPRDNHPSSGRGIDVSASYHHRSVGPPGSDPSGTAPSGAREGELLWHLEPAYRPGG